MNGRALDSKGLVLVEVDRYPFQQVAVGSAVVEFFDKHRVVVAANDRGALSLHAPVPLDDLSADPEQAWFADGMTDALINSLARIGALLGWD